MIVPILGIVAMASIALYIAPSMPLYSVKNIQLVHFRFSRSLTVSAKLFTGMEVQNDNILGADLYSTHVDIYYPDWNGVLQHIGYLEETNAKNNEQSCNSTEDEEDDRGICIPIKGDLVPFFSVQPRGKSTSRPGAVTVYLENIAPKTYLHILKKLITQAGSTEILISGVAHVKSPLGFPLSLGLVCDNTVDLMTRPIQILGRSCLIEKISTGWTGLKEVANEVRDRVMDHYHEKDGDIFNRRNEKTNDGGFMKGGEPTTTRSISNGIEKTNVFEGKPDMRDFLSLEAILDWHDF